MSWMRDPKVQGPVLAGLALVLGLIIGHSRPPQIVKQTEWRERIIVRTIRERARHVETVTTKAPSGEVVIRRVEDMHDQIRSVADVKQESKAREITSSLPRLRFTLGAGYTGLPTGYPNVLRLEGSLRLVGPLWIGAWGERFGGKGWGAGASLSFDF